MTEYVNAESKPTDTNIRYLADSVASYSVAQRGEVGPRAAYMWGWQKVIELAKPTCNFRQAKQLLRYRRRGKNYGGE